MHATRGQNQLVVWLVVSVVMFVGVVSSLPSDGSLVVAVGFVVKILPLLIVAFDVVVVVAKTRSGLLHLGFVGGLE